MKKREYAHNETKEKGRIPKMIREKYTYKKIEIFTALLLVLVLDVLLIFMILLALLFLQIKYVFLFIILLILLIKLSLMIVDDAEILKVKESVWILTDDGITRITIGKNFKSIEKVKIPYADLEEIKTVEHSIISNKKDIFILLKENSKAFQRTKQRIFYIQPSDDYTHREILNFVNKIKEKMKE